MVPLYVGDFYLFPQKVKQCSAWGWKQICQKYVTLQSENDMFKLRQGVSVFFFKCLKCPLETGCNYLFVLMSAVIASLLCSFFIYFLKLKAKSELCLESCLLEWQLSHLIIFFPSQLHPHSPNLDFSKPKSNHATGFIRLLVTLFNSALCLKPESIT